VACIWCSTRTSKEIGLGPSVKIYELDVDATNSSVVNRLVIFLHVLRLPYSYQTETRLFSTFLIASRDMFLPRSIEIEIVKTIQASFIRQDVTRTTSPAMPPAPPRTGISDDHIRYVFSDKISTLTQACSDT
jgi:hypothetical protein